MHGCNLSGQEDRSNFEIRLVDIVNFRLVRDVTEELHLRKKKRITINALCDLSTTSVFFFLNAHSLSH